MFMVEVTDCPAEMVALVLGEETAKFGTVTLMETAVEVPGECATSPA